jgi:hypothetical protein
MELHVNAGVGQLLRCRLDRWVNGLAAIRNKETWPGAVGAAALPPV